MPPAESATLDGVATEANSAGKIPLALLIVGIVLALDLLTKAWAVQNLELYNPEQVWGDFFRFTYTHNSGAAFGIDIGRHSRPFFLVLSLLALGVLGAIFKATAAWDRLRLSALALVAGGALGNITDRIRYEAGVVDFLDFGIGAHRFPVFNIADTAVTIGAGLLLISFYLEGRREAERVGAAEPSGDTGGD